MSAADDLPASPCTKVCQLDRATGWCLGCWRTGAEIGAWAGLDGPARRRLLARLAERRRNRAGAAMAAAGA